MNSLQLQKVQNIPSPLGFLWRNVAIITWPIIMGSWLAKNIAYWPESYLIPVFDNIIYSLTEINPSGWSELIQWAVLKILFQRWIGCTLIQTKGAHRITTNHRKEKNFPCFALSQNKVSHNLSCNAKRFTICLTSSFITGVGEGERGCGGGISRRKEIINFFIILVSPKEYKGEGGATKKNYRSMNS